MNFETLGLKGDVLEGVNAMGFDKPTPIQIEAIPKILAGNDLIACSQTGTGKTAAYLLPVLQRLCESASPGHSRVLILAPTRELAQQIDIQFQGFGYFSGRQSVAVYGGSTPQEWDQQVKAIKSGADVIIATPGRFMAYMSLDMIDLKKIECFILDEADRMMDMGFIDDINKIVSGLSTDRQTLMFSATMPPNIRKLSNQILKNPAEIRLAVSKPAERIRQLVYHVNDNQKISLLNHICSNENIISMIIFCASKISVDRAVNALKPLGISARGIHSNKTQTERESVLRDFKNGVFKVLIATDILSRGIDIVGISHIINYDVPNDPEDYIHRIGRTARAKAEGTGITFVTLNDKAKFGRIEKLLGKAVQLEKLPAELGPEPDMNAKPSGHRGKKPFFKSNRHKR